MEKKSLSCCNCNGNIIESDNIEKNNLCPICRRQGTLVKNITVKHMIIEELMERIGDTDYFLCMSEECDISYYNPETKIKFNKQQVKVPLWFKKDAHPKYACYCSKVTEEQIINAIVKDDANNIKDVLKLTGAMKNAQCHKNNPLGKCCHQIIQAAIDKGLSLK